MLNRKQETKRETKVRFDLARNTEKSIVHIDDLSPDEINSIWLSATDFMETKKQYTVIVRMMMKSRGKSIKETDEICCRGLGKSLS